MKVIILRSNSIDPDSRVEKETNAISNAGHHIGLVGWDRSSNKPTHRYEKSISGKNYCLALVGVKSSFGVGFRRNLIPLAKFQIRLLWYLWRNRHQYDVLHACDLDTSFTAFLIAKCARKKLVYDIFDYYVDSFSVPGILKRTIISLDQLIINSADAVIVCSEERVEQIKGSNPKKLIVVHNSPPKLAPQDISAKPQEGRIRIAYVGILGPGRGLLEVVNFVTSNSDLCELHIGGYGLLEAEIEEYSRNNENIVFYGRVPYEKTLQIESACDLITAIYDPLVANHRYAAPNKFYEALMLGKPLLVCNNTGIDRVVEDNDIGVAVNYGRTGIAEGFVELFSKRNNWMSMGERMRSLYTSSYSWEEMERRIKLLYQ